MRSHYQREDADCNRSSCEECPYVLELQGSMGGLDELRFAYVVTPETLSAAAIRSLEGGPISASPAGNDDPARGVSGPDRSMVARGGGGPR